VPQAHHSILIPVCSTTLRRVWISFFICSKKASGVPAAGATPSLRNVCHAGLRHFQKELGGKGQNAALSARGIRARRPRL